jgi:hypothetical protein
MYSIYDRVSPVDGFNDNVELLLVKAILNRFKRKPESGANSLSAESQVLAELVGKETPANFRERIMNHLRTNQIIGEFYIGA